MLKAPSLTHAVLCEPMMSVISDLYSYMVFGATPRDRNETNRVYRKTCNMQRNEVAPIPSYQTTPPPPQTQTTHTARGRRHCGDDHDDDCNDCGRPVISLLRICSCVVAVCWCASFRKRAPTHSSAHIPMPVKAATWART